MARYRQKSFVLGRTVQFTQQGVTYEGIAKDITNTGELVVETATERKVLSSEKSVWNGIDAAKVANPLVDSLLSQGISQSNRKYKHSINRPAYSEGSYKRTT